MTLVLPETAEFAPVDVPQSLAAAVRDVRLLYDADNYEAALDACNTLLQRYPRRAEGLLLLGLISYALDEPIGAIELLHQAQNTAPDVREYADALASIYAHNGKDADALYYAKMAAILPGHPLGEKLLPNQYTKFFRNLQSDDSHHLRQNAEYRLAHNDPAGALGACEKQLEMSPGDPDTLRVLARAALLTGDIERAIAACHSVLHNRPVPQDRITLVHALALCGRFEEADFVVEEALAADPDAISIYHLRARLAAARFGSGSGQHAATNADWLTKFGAAPLMAPSVFANAREPDRVLRIGYLNDGFDTGAAAKYLGPLLTAHDRSAVEIYFYAAHTSHDVASQSLRQFATRQTDIENVDPDTTAEILRGDGIDIAVDMTGHGPGSQLRTIIHKPAPICVSWLGAALPAGAGFDYLLADAALWPDDSETCDSATSVWRLPHGPLAPSMRDAPETVAPLPATANGHLTIGVAAPLGELGPQAVRQWRCVLDKVSDAQLVVYNRARLDSAATNRLIDLISHAGIFDRVSIAETETAEAHEDYAAYKYFDLMLDPQPNSRFIDCCNALWMGVPVLAVAGAGYSGRQAAAALTAAGKAEWIFPDNQALADHIAGLARHREGLAALRAGLRGELRASPLYDIAGFTRHLETAYRDMWRRWCNA